LLSRESVCATSLHLVPSAQEASDAIVDLAVDGFVSRCAGAMTEIRCPAGEKPVETFAHARPRPHVSRLQKIPDLGLDPQHALVGWACCQIPSSTFGKVARSQRVAKEIEALPPCVLDRGLRLVQRQPEFRHRRSCPDQRLVRVAATEDNEIVGVGDDMRAKSFAASAEPPMLEETVHVDVGEQGTHDAALRRAARVTLASTHSPFPIIAPLLNRHFQP
jgi:hypothetical protein